MVELADVAAELYGLVPAEFTAARTARAKEARTGGDAALAKTIGALPKPATSAAVLNLLVRARPDELERLFELGAALRAAQDELDRTELQRLGRARQELVRAIARQGTAIAVELGMTVSPSAVNDVEQTLQAALADPDAEGAVRTGCLIRPLASTGLEPVDTTHALAIPSSGGTAAKGDGTRPASGTDAEHRDEAGDSAAARGRAAREAAASKRREEAQRAADEAIRHSEEAETRLAEVERSIDDLSPRRAALEDELTDLQQKADEVTTMIAALARESDRLERERAAAADRADTALARERRARERLDAIG
ncbi:hypothetical protein [Glaciibacter sp. 2TAF33]|uniref:hypothetical protein n=1 Tax=Glaciibacter sp. 2TAF33 TaxID=3233015 RepID=UPI003F925062